MDSFSYCCRFCLKNSQKFLDYNIRDDNGDTYYEKITQFIPDLKKFIFEKCPHFMCSKCVDILNTMVTFKETCLKSQKVLFNYNEHLKSIDNRTVTIGSDNLCDDCCNNNLLPIESIKLEPFGSLSVSNNIETKSNYISCNLNKGDKEDEPFIDENGNKPTTIDDDINHVQLESNGDDELEQENQKSTSLTFDNEPLLVYTKNYKIPIKQEEDDSAEETNNKDQTSNNLSSNNSEKKSFPCSICGETFTRLSSLKYHNLYNCEACGKTFCRQQHLKSHALIHCGERPFTCQLCAKIFIRQGDLKVHENTVHAEKNSTIGKQYRTKSFKCKACGKSFYMRQNLKYHERMHTGEKLYPCHMCGKKFTHLSYLKIHERIHTGEKPFRCESCDRTFCTLQNLKIHSTVHRDEKSFACKMCKKTFARLKNLRCHECTHTGERPFVCKTCGKNFTHMNTLKVHERIHSSKKPYHCKLCDKNFTQLSNLHAHTIRHVRN